MKKGVYIESDLSSLSSSIARRDSKNCSKQKNAKVDNSNKIEARIATFVFMIDYPNYLNLILGNLTAPMLRLKYSDMVPTRDFLA